MRAKTGVLDGIKFSISMVFIVIFKQSHIS